MGRGHRKTINNCFHHAGPSKVGDVAVTDDLENAMESVAGVTFLHTTAHISFLSIRTV